jgi:glycosyltransferase involved in cell wall biosynthesis
MRKIAILHLTSTSRGIGGVERLLIDMARHYDLERFRVAHCNLFDATAGTGPFPAGLRDTGLPWFEIAGSRWSDLPLIVRNLRQLIRRERIDVLHLHMVRATVAGGIASVPRTRAKVLVSKHYRYSMLSSAFARLADGFFTNRSDAAAAVSGSVESDLLAHGMPASHARVIHNGIDLEMFDRRAAEHEPGPTLDRSGPLIACFGSLHRLKGHEYLLRTMPEIVRGHPAAVLLLVGDGPERARLEQLSHALGVPGAVKFLGFQANVPSIMKQIDICVHPSVDEAFGLVLLEAMAAGKPVVATRAGGIGEIVADGATGLLVPPRDPGAIAAAVSGLLGDAELRASMGTRGRARVEERFDIRDTVRSYQELYQELAG